MNSREFLYSKAINRVILSNECNQTSSLSGSDPMPWKVPGIMGKDSSEMQEIQCGSGGKQADGPGNISGPGISLKPRIALPGINHDVPRR